jgi:cytochrome c-type protein NapC
MIRKIVQGVKRVWDKYLQWHARWPVTIFVLTILLGVVLWGGFNTTLSLTNTESFCISCHEMYDNVYQEYKQTVHYTNRTGVRATCPDCHVPREWTHMLIRKVGATNELFFKLLGSINTPEKFRAKRLQLAEIVWRNMQASDSRECRNCHSFSYMALLAQKKTSQRAHKRAVQNKLTCISCHMGIAHKISKKFDKNGELHEQFRKTKRACADCHKDMAQAPDDW